MPPRSSATCTAALFLAFTLASCSTGPSAGCELTVSGPVHLTAACPPVVFEASGGESNYSMAIAGPPAVAMHIGAAIAPTTYGWGQDDGDSESLSVSDSGAVWVSPSIEGFHLQFTDVKRSAVVGDATFFTTHGSLTATLIPDTTTTAKDTVMLRMTF